MSKNRYIWLDGVKVSVTEEVFHTYQRAEWREEKQQEVRKNRECSYEFMCKHNFDGQAVGKQPLVDEIVAAKMLLDELHAALDELADDERTLIDALYYQDKSECEISKETGIPRNTIVYRKNRILDKLKKIIKKI